MTLLIVGLVCVLPGGELAYYLPKLAIGAVAIVAAAYAPATGRLPRSVAVVIAVGAVVLVVAALVSSSPLSALIGRAPRYEGVLGLSVYAGLLWAGARLIGSGADVATLRFFRRGLAVDSIVIALLYVLEGTGLRPLGGSSNDRTGSFLGNATDAGLVGVILLVLMIATLARDRSPLIWLGIVGAAVTVGLSESRAAVLAAAVAFVVVGALILAHRSLRSRRMVLALGAVPVAVVAAVLAVPGALHRMTGGSAGKSAHIRIETWTETLNLIAHHWILGVGPSGFVEAILPYQNQRWADLVGFGTVIDSPHNLLLQTLSAGGVVLLAVAIVLLVLVVLRAVSVMRFGNPDVLLWQVACSAVVAGTLVALLTHFSTPSILIVFLPVLGSLVGVPVVPAARVKGAPLGRVRAVRDSSLVWRPAGIVLAVVLVAASAAEVPVRQAIAAATSGDAAATIANTNAERVLRVWDADSVSTIAQAAAQGTDSAASQSTAAAMAALAATDGLEARGRLGGSSAATLAAVIGLAHEGQSAQATTLLNDLIARSPYDDSLYVRRGVLLAQSGSSDAAVADFTRALAINPHNADARSDLRIVQGLN